MRDVVYFVDDNLVVIPFSDSTPLFLSNNYYKRLNLLKKYKGKFIIFTFYVNNFYRNELNALLIHNNKILSIFGESFSKKNCEFKLKDKSIFVMFYFDTFSNKFKVKNDIDLFISLDNQIYEDSLDFHFKKFKNKIFFV